MLPYPSGELHMGHVKNYTMGDVVTLFRRRNGDRVMHPMGYDAFGLPAENAAIKSGRHPAESTAREHRRDPPPDAPHGLVDRLDARGHHQPSPSTTGGRSGSSCGCSRPGLAYRRAAPVKWCPVDQTVLANEQVIDGHCERCGALVEARNLEQWFFKITDYADRLLDDLPTVHWPERVVTMQRNWIGRSRGRRGGLRACDGSDIELPVFTTRPDTLFGATFFVLAPEHPLAAGAGGRHRARGGGGRVRLPHGRASRRSSGPPGSARRPASSPAATCVNPVNGEQIPVWVADYVLMEYGTGAIMAVPAHDERDFELRCASSACRSARSSRPQAAGRPRPRPPT